MAHFYVHKWGTAHWYYTSLVLQLNGPTVRVHWSYNPIVLQLDGPTVAKVWVHWSYSSIVLQPIGPTVRVHWSYSPMVLQLGFIGPTAHWSYSQGSLVLQLNSPTALSKRTYPVLYWKLPFAVIQAETEYSCICIIIPNWQIFRLPDVDINPFAPQQWARIYIFCTKRLLPIFVFMTKSR